MIVSVACLQLILDLETVDYSPLLRNALSDFKT